jgi:hypothetical protein
VAAFSRRADFYNATFPEANFHGTTFAESAKLTLLGTLRRTPPAADQHDPDSKRYRWRLARRTLGIAQAHALHQHISSARAIGRQLGVNHGTVREWFKLTPPDAATIAELSDTPDLLPSVEPPPVPWHD